MILGYNCGPMAELSLDEANSWRDEVTQYFADNTENIRSVNPTRGKVPTDKFGVDYDNSFRSRSSYIFKRDFNDVKKCDFMFIHFPITARNLSIGSIVEIGWATVLQKPMFVITHNQRIAKHPLIKEPAVWIGNSLEKGVEVVVDYFDRQY